MDIRRILFDDYRHASFRTFAVVMSAVALRPNTSIIPLITTLSGLLFYSAFIFRPTDPFINKIWLWLLLSIGSSVSKVHASLEALSSPGTSAILLLASSLFTSALTLLVLFVNAKLSTRLTSNWSRTTVFPALWATMWFLVSYISPVGHLLTWSVADNSDAYNWLVPVMGPASKDWLVGAWSVLCSNLIGTWYIGPQNEDEDLPTILPINLNPTATLSRMSHTTSNFLLASILVLLIPPSLFFDNIPLPVSTLNSTTPLSVGCVLPTFSRYKHHHLTLDDYVKESEKIRASTRVILWPEGAVLFQNATERDESFDYIRSKLPGTYIGVSFEEIVEDPNDPTGRTSQRRTGIAVISQYSPEPHLVYYKRNLVPIAESFSLRHSTLPPTVFLAQIPKPNEVTKGEWAPAPNYTRPLPITTSICLDFATPAPFSDLDVRPALILAPARTWDRTVGYAMWLQAKQRAEELGTTVLWCDGGDGGVSGIAGGGLNDVTQVGQGSFVRTVGFEYPFNDRPTLYGKFGDFAIIMLFWLISMAPVVDLPVSKGNIFMQLKSHLQAPYNRRPNSESVTVNLLD